MFYTKYFEGSIYTNSYLGAGAGIVGTFLAWTIHTYWRIKWSFVFSFSLVLFFSIFLLCFQQNYLSSNWVEAFMTSPCPYPEGSDEAQAYYLAVLIPANVFFIKIGSSASF